MGTEADVNHLKIFVALVILSTWAGNMPLQPRPVWAQQEEEKLFSTRGKLTEINLEEKVLRLKNEGGLELTFLLTDTTQVKTGEAIRPLADLAVDDSVKMDYRYNENYEKVVRTIEKEPRGNSTTAFS